MNKILFLLFAASMMAEETTIPKLPQTALSATASLQPDKNVLIIDPKARAADYIQAYDLLRKDKPTLKVTIRTSGGTITNIQDVTLASHGTLLLVKILSNQGSKYQILPIEQIEEIAYSP